MGRTVSFAGLVSSAEERMTKAGDPWGKMLIEDQTGSYEWALFREDYLKWRPFFSKDLILHVKAVIDKRVFRNKECHETVRLNLVPQQIKLLSKVAEEMVDGLEVNLPLDVLNSQRIEKLKAFMSQNQGSKRVVVKLVDVQARHDLHLVVKGSGLNINNETLRNLDQALDGIPFRLLVN